MSGFVLDCMSAVLWLLSGEKNECDTGHASVT